MVIILVLLLIARIGFDLAVSGLFETNQNIKLSFCLNSQPFSSRIGQTFYYQNHFKRIKITVPETPRFDFGDCLEIIGKIDWCDQINKKDLCLLNPSVLLTTNEKGVKVFGFKLLANLRILRNKIAAIFLSNLPYPEADLLAGIVLGLKQTLDKEFYDQLRATGTLHIIVASGYNVSLIGKKPINLLSYLLGRRLATLVGFFLVWFYVLVAGVEPPLIRAAVMVSILFLSQLLGTKFKPSRALFVTAWLMLMFKPDLIINVSFQLSVAALIGLMVGGNFFTGLKKIPFLGSDLAETLSAQIMVSPVIAWHFGQLSIIAPVVNALILPFIPISTIVGLVSIFVSLEPFLSKILLWGIYPWLWWQVFVIEVFSKLSFSQKQLNFSFVHVIVSYFLIFLFFHRKKLLGEKSFLKKTRIGLPPKTRESR